MNEMRCNLQHNVKSYLYVVSNLTSYSYIFDVTWRDHVLIW